MQSLAGFPGKTQKSFSPLSQTGRRRQNPVMRNDAELLLDWARKADESAFRTLVDRYAGLVHGVAVRRTGGQAALAQEIAQNVFTMLARKAGSLSGHPCLASWLHRAAVLESIHQLRRESTHARKLDRLAHHLETMSSSPELPGAAAPGPEIDLALAQLSESDRAVLMMRFFEDRSYKEIASHSGKNEAAARKQVERALTRLTPHLANRSATAAITSAAVPGLAGQLAAALSHAAPQGFAATTGTAALAGAPALTAGQVFLHSLKLMTLGKSSFFIAAVFLSLLTFGGSYAVTSHLVGPAAIVNTAGPAHGPGKTTAAASNSGSEGSKKPPRSPAGNPGDSPARAALRERLRTIGKSLDLDLKNRSFGIRGFGLPTGDILTAIGEFDPADLPEAWKLLPDFVGKPGEYKAVAAFLTSLRLEQDPPREILQDLLSVKDGTGGKAADFALHQALGGWFRQDSAAAWDWLRQAVPKGDFPADRRFNYGSDLVGDWLVKNPAAALAAMDAAGPEWTGFRQAALVNALQTSQGQESLWPVLQKADDRTALLVSDSHLKESDWTRDTVLPWLLMRDWTDGTEPERILHGW
ncbi:MAG: sigE 1, partial [Verrucomicrobiales bacterium]|nr:sigE 1 [Verrucomicrobiales bacterium]